MHTKPLPSGPVRAMCAALAALLLAACGGSDDAAPVAVTATIGAAGGTIDGPGGLQLVIPAGALAQPVVITVARSADGAPALPSGTVALSAVYALTPHGTSFAVPVTVRVPFDPSRLSLGEVPPLWKSNAAQNGWEPVPGAAVSSNMVEGQISSFSWTFIPKIQLPPRIYVQPAPQSVSEPNAATFSVGAASDLNSGVLSYQWKRNGAQITGATGATYTTGPTTVAGDNGAVYSVDVSNDVGVTPSANATLTVSATAPTTAALTVTVTPAGSGTVVSVPAGIDCGADCGETYPLNTVVALTATPAAGFTFSSWSPNCPAGAVTMNAGHACTATFVAVPPPPPAGATRIAAGAGFSLAVKTTGGVAYSWGSAAVGGLGNGGLTGNLATATPIPTLMTGVSAISAREGAVAVRNNGTGTSTVWAWGYAFYVFCGVGTVYDTPVQVGGATDIVAVSKAAGHALLLDSKGAVFAFGCNYSEELGRSGAASATAVRVTGLPVIAAVAAGDGFSLALDTLGNVWSWGQGGTRGDGSSFTAPPRALPVRIDNLNLKIANFSGPTAIAAGDQHALALRSDGSVVAWGRNTGGQLGDGTTTDRTVPTATLLTSQITALAAGRVNSLAIGAGGIALSWGENGYGQLGSGSTTPFIRATPAAVTGLTGVVAIAIGSGGERTHALAVLNDGSVWAWGNNDAGQLGDGTTIERATPVAVSGLNLN